MCADNWIHNSQQRRVTVELSEGTTYEGVRLARCDCGERILVRLTRRLSGHPGGPGYRLQQDVAFPAERVEVGSTTDRPTQRHRSTAMATKNTPSPALQRGHLYLAHDRVVCADCAGMTALHTGRTIGGAELAAVTADDVREWTGYGLGPLRCEGGHLEASVGVNGNLVIGKVA